jgi:hypothetical protein
MRPRDLGALVFIIFMVALLIYCVVVGWIRAGKDLDDTKSGDDDQP